MPGLFPPSILVKKALGSRFIADVIVFNYALECKNHATAPLRQNFDAANNLNIDIVGPR